MFNNLLFLFVFILFILKNNKATINKITNSENFTNKCKYYKTTLNNSELKNLKKGQYIMTNMFKIFDYLCRKNNLKYWLNGGTLIGAVRHKGWIPHDGDIDVSMIIDDYKILREKMIEELSKDKYKNKYWFQDSETDDFYKIHKNKSIMGKIRSLNYSYIDDDNNSIHNGIQIDIFVYQQKNNKLIIENMLPDIINYNYNEIFPLQEIEFENIKVYVQNNYKEILKKFFGGYPPPILDKCKQFPHEGRIGKTEDWTKIIYQKLYKNQKKIKNM